jgi:hypothetical protein
LRGVKMIDDENPHARPFHQKAKAGRLAELRVPLAVVAFSPNYFEKWERLLSWRAALASSRCSTSGNLKLAARICPPGSCFPRTHCPPAERGGMEMQTCVLSAPRLFGEMKSLPVRTRPCPAHEALLRGTLSSLRPVCVALRGSDTPAWRTFSVGGSGLPVALPR